LLVDDVDVEKFDKVVAVVEDVEDELVGKASQVHLGHNIFGFMSRSGHSENN
jgi:hypothetical protein